MATDDGVWCKTCGGEGVIDEARADRLGLSFDPFGRTMVCPTCNGTGEPPDDLAKGITVGMLIILLIAIAIIGGALIGRGLDL